MISVNWLHVSLQISYVSKKLLNPFTAEDLSYRFLQNIRDHPPEVHGNKGFKQWLYALELSIES